MSIDQTNVIDFISLSDAKDEVILTISDHLEWQGDIKEHLLLLQDKVNAYLSFIESGELLQSYPDANNRKPVINLVCKHSLNPEAKDFINQVKASVMDAGIMLRYKAEQKS